MGQLSNLYISQSYQGLIKLADSANAVTNTLQYTQDGLGNNLPIQISTSSVNITGSLTVNGLPISIPTGSFATTGSNIFKGDQTISGSVIFEGGGRIVPNFEDYSGSVDLIAAAGGWAELQSDGGDQFMWVDDNGAYIGTNYKDAAHQWTFGKDGITYVPGDIVGANNLVDTGSFDSYTSSINIKLSGLDTETGSLQNQINALASTGSLNSYTLTSSFNAYTSSNDAKVNDLISKTGSYVTETESGSFVTSVTGSSATITVTKGNGTSNTVTVNNVANATSASFAQTALSASYAPDNSNRNGLITTGSAGGTQSITGSLNVQGTITATSASFTYVNTVYETASVIYSSGSNQLGDASDDIQTLWGAVKIPSGSVSITGSLNVSAPLIGTGTDNGVTSSFLGNVMITGSGNGNNALRVKGRIRNDVSIYAGLSRSGSGRLYVSATDAQSLNMSVSSSLFTNEVYDDAGTYGLSMRIHTTTTGSVFSDYDNGTAQANVGWLSLAPNINNNPAPQMLRGLGITGSLNAPSITGSLLGNASTATSASFATNALSASQAQNAVTASFLNGTIASASFATNAATASIANDVIVVGKCDNTGGLTRGTVVRITGANGDNPLFDSASWSDEASSANVLGMLSEDVVHNGFANVVVVGKVLGLNTNAYTPSTLLYLSSSGQYTSTVPTAPSQSVRLGQVLRQNSTQGSMYFRADNGYELDELHNVVITTPQQGDLLSYISGSYGLWENKTNAQLGLATTSSLANYITAAQTSSMAVASAVSSSYATNALTASYVIGGGSVPAGTVSGSAQIIDLGFATTGSNTFIGNQTFTGSLIVSSSALTDLTVDSRILITGPTSGNTPRLTVSSSLSNALVNRQGIQVTQATPSDINPSINFQTTLGGFFSLFNPNSKLDFGFVLNGTQYGLSGWTGPAIYSNNPGGNYPAAIGFQDSNTWTDGRVTFLTPISASVGITGSLFGTSSFATNALTASYVAGASVPAGTVSGSAQIAALGYAITGSNIFNGDQIITGSLYSSGQLYSNESAGNEGGQLNLALAQSGNTLTGSITLDVYNNKVRLFEAGGTNRGGYWDISALAAGVGTNLAAGGSSFPYTGSAVITGSLAITGSASGNVNALSISSNTASLDLNNGNFFTLQLVSGSATNINPSNIKPGQTVNILLNTTGSGTVTFPTSVKQISGSLYVPTTTTGKDIITLVSFDATSLYLVAAKNLA